MKHVHPLMLSLSVLALSTVAAAGPAVAHPHDSDKLTELREKSKALADKARESGEAFVDSEMITNMSDLLTDLAARVEVEKGEGSGTALWIDGDEVVRFNRDHGMDDTLTVTGLGQNLSVERETVIKNGKTRTRIVIEMDDGEDVDIDFPGAPPKPTVPTPLLNQE
ncbi:MAG: hypothetical protein ACSHX3_01065 [Litorimonas sp.]